ncbi:DUF5997 family protein [Pengzhenrongella frigida]|uniref:Uncharacterized protein n=1 Tax=Pengzhenrongella frigida TaxID=1259133 RepID=A0A4Q5N104_9MICO|nr:DUF5997 family protein [Cellulomonas sp. HLT2-17]RYV50197.1 hypothetical protein EUA98_14760 [Cellulomonas sp. HLT2-17]
MTSAKTQQTMKPVTAAKKLGIHLAAAPESFRDAPAVTRSELAGLMTTPPAWLKELHENGPHPREVVASRLGVSIAGLVRGGITEPLLTSEIVELSQKPPAWLVRERAIQADVRAEDERVAARDAERRSRPTGPRPTR